MTTNTTNTTTMTMTTAQTKTLYRALRAAGLPALPVGVEAAKELNARQSGMRDGKRGTIQADQKWAVQVLARLACPELYNGIDNAIQQLEIWGKCSRNF